MNTNLKLNINDLRRIYSEDTLFGILEERKKFTNYLWHVALPKSGSTWLTAILGNLFASRNVPTGQLVPDHGERSHEIDPRLFITTEKEVFFKQQHCPYSNYTNKLVSLTGTKIIFQYRVVEDALASLVDHFESGLFEENPVRQGIPKAVWHLDREDLKDYVIDIELPWYCKFLSGWITSDLSTSKYFCTVNYDDLNASPLDTVLYLSDALNLGFSEKEAHAAIVLSSKVNTRLNIAMPGRGEYFFTESQKEKIIKCLHYFNLDKKISNLV